MAAPRRRDSRAAYSLARRTRWCACKAEATARQRHRAGERSSAGKCSEPSANPGSRGRPRPGSPGWSAAAGRRTSRPAAGCSALRRSATTGRRTSPPAGRGPAPERRTAASRGATHGCRTVPGRAASKFGGRAISLCRTASGGRLWRHGRWRTSQPVQCPRHAEPQFSTRLVQPRRWRLPGPWRWRLRRPRRRWFRRSRRRTTLREKLR